MASVTATSGYNGEVAGVLMGLTKDGNQAVEKGSVHVEPDVKTSLFIDRFRVADNQLQARAETPTTPSDGMTYDEKELVPKEMMFYDLVNPRNFESVWRPWQPVGPLVDRVDNPQIQAAILGEVAKTIGKQLGKLIWQGDEASVDPNLAYFDGLITNALASADTIKVTPAGNITQANVIATLESVEADIPSELWEDPNFTFHMSTADFRKYLAAARALDFKGSNISMALEAMFGGRQIRFYSGLPENYILAGKGTAGRDSNFWAGVDVMGDESNIKIERYRPESELFIVKALFKYGVQIANDEEVVVYAPA